MRGHPQRDHPREMTVLGLETPKVREKDHPPFSPTDASPPLGGMCPGWEPPKKPPEWPHGEIITQNFPPLFGVLGKKIKRPPHPPASIPVDPGETRGVLRPRFFLGMGAPTLLGGNGGPPRFLPKGFPQPKPGGKGAPPFTGGGPTRKRLRGRDEGLGRTGGVPAPGTSLGLGGGKGEWQTRGRGAPRAPPKWGARGGAGPWGGGPPFPWRAAPPRPGDIIPQFFPGVWMGGKRGGKRGPPRGAPGRGHRRSLAGDAPAAFPSRPGGGMWGFPPPFEAPPPQVLGEGIRGGPEGRGFSPLPPGKPERGPGPRSGPIGREGEKFGPHPKEDRV